MKSDLEMGLLKENNQVGGARGAFSSTYHVQRPLVDIIPTSFVYYTVSLSGLTFYHNVLDIDTFFAPLCFMKPHKKT